MTERYHCCYTKTTENSEKNRKEPERRAYGHGSDHPERKRNRDHRPGIFYCGDAWCTCCGALRDLVEGNRKVADTAGCGGTRAAYALLCGKPLLSLYYHPIVLYTVVVGAAFLVTQTIGRLSRGRFRAVVHFRPVYLWIALALVVINCFVKNFILLYFHIPLL